MKVRMLLCGALMLASAGGCTSGSGEPGPQPAAQTRTQASAPPWTEPANYAYTVERRCAGKPSLGVYQVTVAGGEVSELKRTDGKTASGEEEIDLPTLGGLVELARTAADDGGQMSVSSDPGDGHPTAVAFDVSDTSDNADNTCFVITDYRPR